MDGVPCCAIQLCTCMDTDRLMSKDSPPAPPTTLLWRNPAPHKARTARTCCCSDTHAMYTHTERHTHIQTNTQTHVLITEVIPVLYWAQGRPVTTRQISIWSKQRHWSDCCHQVQLGSTCRLADRLTDWLAGQPACCMYWLALSTVVTHQHYTFVFFEYNNSCRQNAKTTQNQI